MPHWALEGKHHDCKAEHGPNPHVARRGVCVRTQTFDPGEQRMRWHATTIDCMHRSFLGADAVSSSSAAADARQSPSPVRQLPGAPRGSQHRTCMLRYSRFAASSSMTTSTGTGGLDGDVALSLRHLVKKDETTRVKALKVRPQASARARGLYVLRDVLSELYTFCRACKSASALGTKPVCWRY